MRGEAVTEEAVRGAAESEAVKAEVVKVVEVVDKKEKDKDTASNIEKIRNFIIDNKNI